MTKDEITRLIHKGIEPFEYEEVQINEMPTHCAFTVIVPQILHNVEHSKSCGLLWDAFESVIAKASKKKYVDESKMKQSMNTMLFNELRKRGIMIRKDGNA